MTQPKPYAVLHLEIEASPPLDRDDDTPDLELEMRPMNTDKPREEQTREVVLKIVSASGRTTLAATLDESGIDALRAFLDMKP